ncbi:MAG: CRISPR-associated protein Cas5 [Ruminococcaceae bacterium]|nr:CRISPR-associated protein Cas5 [Oscillospiraceae bacterium]
MCFPQVFRFFSWKQHYQQFFQLTYSYLPKSELFIFQAVRPNFSDVLLGKQIYFDLFSSFLQLFK